MKTDQLNTDTLQKYYSKKFKLCFPIILEHPTFFNIPHLSYNSCGEEWV